LYRKIQVNKDTVRLNVEIVDKPSIMLANTVVWTPLVFTDCIDG